MRTKKQLKKFYNLELIYFGYKYHFANTQKQDYTNWCLLEKK